MVRIWAVVLAIAIPTSAFAETEEQTEPAKFPDGLRVMASDLTILRLNPVGLETRARIGVQKKLYPSPKPITENNFFFAGFYPKLNPASAQLGIGGELQPASIFNVRVLGEVQKYFGTFGYLQSFASANANYSDHTLADMKDQGAAATVKHFSVQPMLQLKLGKIALRSLMMFDYWDVPGALAYEPTFDTLLPDKGWSVATDTDVLFVPGNGLAAGIRHSWVKPMYSGAHFADAADQAAYDGKNSHHRVGFFGAYTFKDVGPSRFNKPTAILIVSFYVKHKYRAGEPSTFDPGHDADDYRTRAFPYLIAGFAFESDFIDVR
ncbi:MAG TPA: hypothetical protein VMZ53_01550 [Kofleriaceae bacterium]|nr:hypothetical protein [Kofleriaceae bacterium]